MTLAAVVFAIATATPSTPTPAAAPTPMSWVEGGAAVAGLTHGRGTWRSVYLAGGAKRGRREFDAEYLRTQRFGIADDQLLLGTYWPSSTQTIAHVEFDYSPTHGTLPQTAFAASLEHRLAGGWGYILGAGARTYTGLGVQTESFVVDRYWTSFRAAYTVDAAELSNVPGIALDHAFSFTHYYGADQSSAITLSTAVGRDVENVGPAALLVLPTFSIGASGRHTLRRIAIVWSFSSDREGALYHRTEVDLGIRHAF